MIITLMDTTSVLIIITLIIDLTANDTEVEAVMVSLTEGQGSQSPDAYVQLLLDEPALDGKALLVLEDLIVFAVHGVFCITALSPTEPHFSITAQVERAVVESALTCGTVERAVVESALTRGTVERAVVESALTHSTVERAVVESALTCGTVERAVVESALTCGTVERAVVESALTHSTVERAVVESALTHSTVGRAVVEPALTCQRLKDDLSQPLLHKPHLLAVAQMLRNDILTGEYDARMRVLIRHMSSLLHVPLELVEIYEESVVEYLREEQQELTEVEKKEVSRRQRNKKIKRYAWISLATIGGGAVLGLTGGLAAPLIGAGVGTILGGASAAALGSTAGIAIIGSLFGVAGAGLTGTNSPEFCMESTPF
uniref:Uncharacterized protein n=1 Tax=Timema monikensis TaxID=170555 RepID=A0A7R9HUX2_9NEOP|nr:unnamed protein product [Timema monikensis]